MAEPIDEQIMAAIAAQLGTIASPSYATSPSLVTRSLLWITQYEQPLAPPATATQLDSGPVLGVVRGSGSAFTRLEHQPAGSGGYEHEIHFTVWGYVKATASVIADTLLRRLWDDHKSALMDSVTFRATLTALPAWDLEPAGERDTDDGVLEPLGYFAQDWRVKA